MAISEWGTEFTESYYGISGPSRMFSAGETIIVTWYNDSDKTLRFYPLISFTDDDSSATSDVWEWDSMSFAQAAPHSLIKTYYKINNYCSGTYSLVNIAPRFSNVRDLILDKIEITDPGWTAPDDGIFSDVRKTRTITAHVYTGHQAGTGDTEKLYNFIPNGKIIPGSDIGNLVQADYGSSETFTFQPDPGLNYYEVYVDGQRTDITNDQYTFTNITRDHVISVGYFTEQPDQQNSATLNITHNTAGTVGPSGQVTVPKGSDIFPKYIPHRRLTRKITLTDQGEITGTDYYIYVARRELHMLDVQEDHDIHVDYHRGAENTASYYYTEEDFGLYQSGDSIPDNTVNPDSIEYLGAFKVPEGNWDGDNYFSWSYSNGAIAYSPDGDPGNADDFSGSLFGIDHVYRTAASEITIPTPVNSRDLDELPRAEYIQHPTDISDLYEDIVQELVYSSSQDKLFWSQGAQSYGDTESPRFGWTEPLLGHYDNESWVPNPQSAGYWHVGDTFKTGTILFEIPSVWAANNLDDTDKTLVITDSSTTGHAINGMNFYAVAPWAEGDPPPDQTRLDYEAILEYGSNQQNEMHRYTRSSSFIGAAWVQDGNSHALILVQKQGYGSIWYNGRSTGSSGEAGNGTKLYGLAYDPIHNYIYISETRMDGTMPIIHVFRMGNK